jgi:hypothetical protein
MAKKAEADPKEVVKAFRRAASELGCDQSEQRFQEALFAIGRHKALRGPPKSSRQKFASRPRQF